MAEKTIRIRYKHSDMSLGDMSSFNPHNQIGGWPAPKYAGYEEDIPATLLDDKHKKIGYKEQGRIEFITEREKRKREHQYGGFEGHAAFRTPAPPANIGNVNGQQKILVPARQLDNYEMAEFLKKQEIGLHYLKEFNPICMEIVGDLPDEVMALAKKEHPEWFEGEEVARPKTKKFDGKIPDITKIAPQEAIKIINEVKDPDVLREFRVQETKLGAPRPMVLTAIEGKISTLMTGS